MSATGGDLVEFQLDVVLVRRAGRVLLWRAARSAAGAVACVLLMRVLDRAAVVMVAPAAWFGLRAGWRTYGAIYCWRIQRPRAAQERVLRVGPDGFGCLRSEHFEPWSRVREATIRRDAGRIVLRLRPRPWLGRPAGERRRRRRAVLIPALYGATLDGFVQEFGRHIAMADPSRGRRSWRPVIPVDE